MHLSNISPDCLARAAKVRLAIFDVDGVMTDGSLFLGDDGQEYKAFNSLDGHGLKMLRKSGVELAIITGRTSNVVLQRAKNLGIPYVHQGAEDKLAVYQDLLRELNISAEETSYMGDDVVDLPVLRRAGLAVTVPASPLLVKEHCHFVTPRAAGQGAVRDLCELLLIARGKWDEQMAPYLA